MFILRDDFLIYQKELEDYQKRSKAIFAVNIDKDDILDVDIKEKVVMTENGPKTLLKDIKFEAKPGELILVLGSSGAGKSTFFNEFLNEHNSKAQISIGNIDFAKNFDLAKRMVSTVPQFDLSRDNDTVFMTLKNSGELKLPRDFTKDDNLLDAYVIEILDMMNLSRLKDSLVKDLSGGERKRLSIASEYIASPVVFLLDEPDSGLDGYNARSIMANLRTIADNGKIIMVISHSPDRTVELYDKILVLGKSQTENCGELAFYGSPDEAMEFFDTKNIETIVDRLLDDTDYYVEKFNKKGKEMNYLSKKEQIKVYYGKLIRDFKNKSKLVILLGAITTPLIVRLITGPDSFLTTSSDAGTAVFILACACLWLGIFNSITSICKERDIIKHEYREGLDIKSYIAKSYDLRSFDSFNRSFNNNNTSYNFLPSKYG